MEKDHYTIKDIAALAKVSRGTVDRVLHNRGKVSLKTQEKVKKILAQIDYQPDYIARNLKKNKVIQLAVVIPDHEMDPYWFSCYKSIHHAKKEFKNLKVKIKLFTYNLNLAHSNFEQLKAEIISGHIDGVSFVPGNDDNPLQLVEICREAGIPFTIFNTPIEQVENIPFVGQDLFQSGRVGAELLYKLLPGGGEIALVHIDEEVEYAIHMQQKESGFYSYFQDKKGYKIQTFQVKENENDEALFLKQLSKNPNIKGLFVTTSKAYRLVDGLKKLDREMHVVGYDLVEKNIRYLYSGDIDFLIHQNQQEQAYLSISMLVDFFVFQKDIPKQKLLPIDIVGRENASFYLQEP